MEISVEIIGYVWDSNYQYFNFAKANFKKLNRELSTITWSDYNGDIEVSAFHFNNIITKLFEKYVPVVIVNKSKSTSPWF